MTPKAQHPIGLVITSAVYAVAGQTELKDHLIREKQYLESLNFWIEKTPVKKIIICDNSGYNYSPDLISKAALLQKEVEILAFKGNAHQIDRQGKGYGEGEILHFVSEHSRLFRQIDGFFKITGRLTVANFPQILRHTKTGRNYFQSALGKPQFLCRAHEQVYKERIDTRFYYCQKDFFDQHLLDSYTAVDDGQEIYLENVYYRALKGRKFYPLLPLPVIIGYSGSTGKPYQTLSPIKYRLYNVLFRIFGA